MPLVPGYAAGSWIRRWFLAMPLVPGYAAGSWLRYWFLATLLVPGYATGLVATILVLFVQTNML